MTQLVRLHVWRIPRRAVPVALARMAVDPWRLRTIDGLLFGKLLGTSTGGDPHEDPTDPHEDPTGAGGSANRAGGGANRAGGDTPRTVEERPAGGRGFGPTDTDLTRYAAVTVWRDAAAADRFDAGPVGRGWARLARAQAVLDLAPLSSRGRWSGREPFAPDLTDRPGGAASTDGPVLVLTRARLRPTRALTFWRAVPPVVDALRTAGGVVARFGIGEAPIGWQGTVSVWRSAADLVDFAYRQPQHRAAIARTTSEGWYAEELFARFAVHDVRGDAAALGWTEGRDGRV